MSFLVHTDRNADGTHQTLKFKIGSEGLNVERVMQLLRSGYVCEGGFLANKKQEIVFDVEAGGEYYFTGFKKNRSMSISEGPAEIIVPIVSRVAQSVPSTLSAPAMPPSAIHTAPVTTQPAASILSEPKKKPRAKAIPVVEPPPAASSIAPSIPPTTNPTEASGLADDATKKGKRKNKPRLKDPLAPKKPPSPYLLFSGEKQTELKLNFPEMKPNDIMAKIGELWRELPEHVKEPYVRQALLEKAEYTRQLDSYLREHPESVLHQVEKAKKGKTGASEAAPLTSFPMHNYDDEDEDDDEDEPAPVHRHVSVPVAAPKQAVVKIPVSAAKTAITPASPGHDLAAAEEERRKAKKEKKEKKEKKRKERSEEDEDD